MGPGSRPAWASRRRPGRAACRRLANAGSGDRPHRVRNSGGGTGGASRGVVGGAAGAGAGVAGGSGSLGLAGSAKAGCRGGAGSPRHRLELSALRARLVRLQRPGAAAGASLGSGGAGSGAVRVERRGAGSGGSGMDATRARSGAGSGGSGMDATRARSGARMVRSAHRGRRGMGRADHGGAAGRGGGRGRFRSSPSEARVEPGRCGRTLRGTMRDIDLSKSQFPLILQGGGEPEPIYRADVKAIFFMLAPGEPPHAGDGAKVRVTFADGRAIEGIRDGADAKHGFFLVPLDAARTNTRCIYVAREATSDIKDG